MVVKSLDLKNFRNYHELHIDFDPFTNIFYGNNAQGKTNILEALYLAGTTTALPSGGASSILNYVNWIRFIFTICPTTTRS